MWVFRFFSTRLFFAQAGLLMLECAGSIAKSPLPPSPASSSDDGAGASVAPSASSHDSSTEGITLILP